MVLNADYVQLRGRMIHLNGCYLSVDEPAIYFIEMQ
ncbi:Uncharacterised protein [Yersinia intermedia]|nr:Uncharacterised protein [Yersinia intermedia]CNC28056.1 Uncharacterised protein [Yersinia intermedia]CNG94080.1 Uncharacterised protein [Yersinia intermedia]CQJ65718.1 Uncharacterised protein [Yersinia intermedia]